MTHYDDPERRDLVRRVIQVDPDQVIGPIRKRRSRRPPEQRHDPMVEANWLPPMHLTPEWFNPPNAPIQRGFGHFDEIARRMKQP